jgi:hypothetical protein
MWMESLADLTSKMLGPPAIWPESIWQAFSTNHIIVNEPKQGFYGKGPILPKAKKQNELIDV